MLLARQIVLHQHLDDHRRDHERRREPGPVAPAEEDREADDRRRGAGVDDQRVRRGQSEDALGAERDADPRVRRTGQRRHVRDHQRPEPAERDLGDSEHQQYLRQRAPHRQIQRRYEQRERGAQQGDPERVLGLHEADAADRAEAPGLVLDQLEERREADRPERHRKGPPLLGDERLPQGRVQRTPLAARERPHPVQRLVSRCLRCSHLGRPGASRKPSARPAATPMRSRSALFSKSMKRGSQIGRYLALAR